MKKKISLLLIIALIFSLFTAVAGAENAVLKGVKSYNNVVNIKGELDRSYAGKSVSIMLLDNEVNIESVQSTDIKYINQLKVSANGKYNISFSLPQSVNAADCKVYARMGNEDITNSVVEAVSNAAETVDYNLGLTVDVATATAMVAVEDDFNLVSGDAIEFIPMIGFYDEDGNLIKFVQGDKNETVLTAAIPDGMYKTKAFVWKNTKTFIPLCQSKEQIGKKDNLNILIIGNSFSVDGTKYLKDLADAAGVRLGKVAVIQHGGSRLRQHWEYRDVDGSGNPYFNYEQKGSSAVKGVALDYAFERGIDWDYVLLQEWRPDVGTYEDEWAPYLFNLATYVKEKCPDAQLALQMTWAFERGRVESNGFDGTVNGDVTGMGQKQMWANSYAFNKRAASELGAYVYDESGDTLSFGGYPVKIVPSGYAVQYAKSLVIDGIKKFDTIRSAEKFGAAAAYLQELHETDPDAKLIVQANDLLADEDAGKIRLHRDGFHMSMAGRYLIGCVWLETLTGVSPVGNTFIPGEDRIDSDIGSHLGITEWINYSGLDAQTCALLQQVAHDAVTAYNNGDTITIE